MTPFFPSIDSPELDRELAGVSQSIDALERTFENLGIGGELRGSTSAAFDQIITEMNELLKRARTLGAYITCVLTTDTRDATAQAKQSLVDQLSVRLDKLRTRFTAWLGTLDIDALLRESEEARSHEYAVRKAQERARHLMSPAEESLAAELRLTGSTAWSKLHGDVSSQMDVLVHLPDGDKTLPMSMVRNLAYDSDRDVRRAGYEAEMRAWKTAEVPLSAAMNSIKGEVETLCKRRNWDTPLDEALFGANIDRSTLEAMMAAARESFPTFRRYLQAKAKMLGLERLAWFDIFAPVGSSEGKWEYDQACIFVERHFASYSPKMGSFARRTFDENWTDAPPLPGKVDGAYCMGMGADLSRILMNFKPAFGSVSTLAHELGHAYHNLCLAERTPIQRSTPMTLAETASIFCETIIRQAALREGTPEEQLSILEASLQSANQVVVDISSRFLFEQSVFDGRSERELSPDELNEKMLAAQRATYGDGLDDAFLHPYMWAVKPHYYDADSFYNYPYMFGLLFGTGLYAIYEKDPGAFRDGYDDLLSSTGLADAATLAQRFGIDIRSTDFWRGSLQIIGRDIDRFVQLAG
jgi:oligoendopeptidase F